VIELARAIITSPTITRSSLPSCHLLVYQEYMARANNVTYLYHISLDKSCITGEDCGGFVHSQSILLLTNTAEVLVNSALVKQSFMRPVISFRIELVISRFPFFFSKVIRSFFSGPIVLIRNASPRATGTPQV
jgi:hypothetical protein